jgi:hypothetical protein
MEVSGQLKPPSGRLTSGGKSPWYHWIGDLVGSKGSLDLAEKKKILHFWESDQAMEPVACCCTNWVILSQLILI